MHNKNFLKQLQKIKQNGLTEEIRTKILHYLHSPNQFSEDDIDSLYTILSAKEFQNEDEAKFLLYKMLRKKTELIDLSKLATALNYENLFYNNTLPRELFLGKIKKVMFPIANGEKEELATAWVIELKKKIHRLDSQNSSQTEQFIALTFSQSSEKQEALQLIAQLLKKNFFVVFDRSFQKKSFMLAIAAALRLEQKILDRYAFSGVFNEFGELFSIDYAEKKERIVVESNRLYISSDHLDHLDELFYWLDDTPVPLPFIQLAGRPDPNFSNLRKLERVIQQNEKDRYFSLEKLERFFQLKKEDLFLYHAGFLSNEKEYWENYLLEEVSRKLQTCYKKIDIKPRILHFAGSVAALAMGIGVLLGNKHPTIVYHFQGDEYIPVLELSDKYSIRAIKRIRDAQKELKKIEVKVDFYKKDDEEVPVKPENWGVAIYLASHNPFGDTRRYLQKLFGDNFGFIKIRAKDYQGAIPLPPEDSWEDYVSELYSLINQIQDDGKIGKDFEASRIQYYHFFISMPVPLAFAFGRALGHFINATVYNFIPKKNELPNSYAPVFELHKLKSRI